MTITDPPGSKKVARTAVTIQWWGIRDLSDYGCEARVRKNRVCVCVCVFSNAITLEVINNLTPSYLVPGDCNVIVPFKCWMEEKTTKVLSYTGLRGVVLIE